MTTHFVSTGSTGARPILYPSVLELVERTHQQEATA